MACKLQHIRCSFFSYATVIPLVAVAASTCRTWPQASEIESASTRRNDTVSQNRYTADELDNDLTAYAEQCKAELGITAPLPDLNCLNGVEVPITVNGDSVNAALFEELKTHRQGCDRAQWLDGECWNYDLIQRVEIPSNQNVEGVLNCRQKTFNNHLSPKERIAAYTEAVSKKLPPSELNRLFSLIYEFDDLGLILRNRNSGKTCFFTFFGSFEKGRTYYGGWIPAPDRRSIPSKKDVFANLLPSPKPPESYPSIMWNRGPKGTADMRNMFFSPKQTAAGNCVVCHNQGAFKHSPFIMQAHDAKGLIVPNNPPNLPYLLVGPAFQQSFREAQHREVTTSDIDGEPQVCTSCHRMATGSQLRFEWSVGNSVPHPSKFSATFPGRAWMPEDHGNLTGEAYAKSHQKHINAMRCCIQHPMANGCLSRAFGPTIMEIGGNLNEPLSENGWIKGSERSGECIN